MAQDNSIGLVQRHELLRNEYQAIRRKLESKNDALVILSSELSECTSQRDQYQLMAEQLRTKYQIVKRKLNMTLNPPETPTLTAQEQEVADLKQQLADAQGDIKLLREKIARHRLGTSEFESQRKDFAAHERETLVAELEKSKDQYAQLEQDMKQLFDEREELVTERDTYKAKYNRLNEELNYILRGDEKHLVDIDALTMENRFLQQRVKQMEEENSMALATVTKYKSILQKRKPTGILKNTPSQVLGGLMVSQKQIKRLLGSVPTGQAPNLKVVEELKTLACTLLETINDKNLALSHQRKSNKLLASRITDLESKLHHLEIDPCRGHIDILRRELALDCSNLRALIPRAASDSGDTSSSHSQPDNSEDDSTHSTPIKAGDRTSDQQVLSEEVESAEAPFSLLAFDREKCETLNKKSDSTEANCTSILDLMVELSLNGNYDGVRDTEAEKADAQPLDHCADKHGSGSVSQQPQAP